MVGHGIDVKLLGYVFMCLDVELTAVAFKWNTNLAPFG